MEIHLRERVSACARVAHFKQQQQQKKTYSTFIKQRNKNKNKTNESKQVPTNQETKTKQIKKTKTKQTRKTQKHTLGRKGKINKKKTKKTLVYGHANGSSA